MSPTTAHPQRSCPITPSQDGVCGCPAFWSTSPLSIPTPEPTPMDEPTLLDEPTTPSSPLRETCFFWYHKAYPTWPIVAPPGSIHYEKCKLPMCPLRWDLVAIKGKGMEVGVEMGAKGEEKGMETEMEMEMDVLEGLIDPSSRAMDGEYGSGSESGEEVEVSTLSLFENPDANSAEEIDRAPPSPSASNDEPPLFHPKRKRLPSTSPSLSANRTNTSMSNHSDPSIPSHAPITAPTGPHLTMPPRPGAAAKICFKWYHSQPCSQQRRGKCRYTHFISEHGGEVSLPLGIHGHRGCALELCPLRAREAKFERKKKTKAKKVKVENVEVSIVGRGGRSWLERQRGTGEDTEQELAEMRRRVMSDRKERMARDRLMEGRLDYGDEVAEKQEGDGRLRKSDRVSRWDMTFRQKVQPRVLVDYELPGGEERLKWDTDLVRRMFGEIE